MTQITLTDEEATSFLKWREHQATFDVLMSTGVFDIRNGSAELHFDRTGQLASIDTHVKVFRIVYPHVDKPRGPSSEAVQ